MRPLIALTLIALTLIALAPGENHLVLSSVLEDGTNAILDNRHPRVMTREELPGYKWMYMSGLNKGDPWHRIAG